MQRCSKQGCVVLRNLPLLFDRRTGLIWDDPVWNFDALWDDLLVWNRGEQVGDAIQTRVALDVGIHHEPR